MDTLLSQLKPKHLIWGTLVLCLAVFGQTLMFGFTALDDSKHIWSNPYVTTLSADNLLFFWREAYYGLFVPVVYNMWAILSFISQSFFPPHEITKYSAAPFHFFNLFIHIFSVLMAYHILHLLISLFQKDSKESLHWAVLLATLPFAIHPLQTEPVAWASGLKDVLMGFFLLLSLGFYLRVLASDQLKPRKFKKKKKTQTLEASQDFLPELFTRKLGFLTPKFEKVLTLIFFIAALLTKPAAVILLPVLALVHWFFFPKIWQKNLALLGTMTAATLSVVFWTKSLQPTSRLDFDYHTLLQAQTIFASAGFYLVKSVMPFGLSPDYGLTPERLIAHSWFPAFLTSGLFLFGLSAWCFFKKSLLGFGALVFVIGILPVLGIIPFEYQKLSTVADRYTYTFTQIGFGLIILGLILQFNKEGLKATTLILASVLSALTFLQVRHWRDNKTLFSQVLKVNPTSHLAYNNLGIYAMRTSDFVEAEQNLIKATQLKQDYHAAESNLGVVYFKQKRYQKVVDYYTGILSKYPEKKAGDPATFADMHYNLGAAMVNTGKVEGSVYHLKKATEINVLHFKAHYQLARVLFFLKRFEEGKQSVASAYRLKPGHVGLQQLIRQMQLTLSN